MGDRLTKAQERVIEALAKDWQEAHTRTGWEFYDPDNKWFYCDRPLIIGLYRLGFLIQTHEPAIIYSKLELTSEGRALAISKGWLKEDENAK